LVPIGSSRSHATGWLSVQRDPGRPEGSAANPAKSVQIEIVLVSNVTAPVRAQAAPQVISAPVFSVMLACARMSPVNDVVVPSVAELPTFQNTFRLGRR
jgi:hypothetical protein